MGFEGWPDAALDFYRGLEVDNSKAYWTAHKDSYERDVLAPMQALVDELAPEFGEAKIFRPYRDIRFSADKSPYKTAIGALLGGGGYVHFSASGLGAGAGCHTMAPDQLARYRTAVADDELGEELEEAIATVKARDIQITVHESLASAPRGFPKDHPRAELLRNKDLSAWREWKPAPWLNTPQAADRIIGFLHDSRPLTEWLDANVGATTQQRSR
ncbi:DUF2461 domain-containing protein [Diaminobutyricibacter tongyongensis]|uniref:DUF2461 domain-containing protein n=1 Tax=Leifsonia tongyongensis TaxID=1268043 RepID=A0A6L9Y2V2_9MICO|nr:DUF2461 domain-containing protein [Diaminobutyricibacter tongyongensis]NEN07989.1 DUF2461 domain-containing protein [Diaminobutyricibacter tongyongensis]